MSRSDLYNMLCDYDSELQGKLSFKDYIDAVSGKEKPHLEDTKGDYQRAFKKVSAGKEAITKEDLLKNIN